MLHVILRGSAALALAAIAGAASAQTAGGALAVTPGLSTGTLAEICAASGAQAEAARGYCRGFLVGVGQYHAEVTRPGGRAPIFCLPDPAPSLDAAQAAFAEWGRANPQHAAEKAVDGLLRWAAIAYPCPATTATSARR
jgi:hypothetical protein